VLTLKMGYLERQVHTKHQSLDSACELKAQPGLRKESPGEQSLDGKELNLGAYAAKPKVGASMQVKNEVHQLGPRDQITSS
jgi:hypothetical protein